MKRGEIWSVAGAGYAGKPRPSVIIQEDRFSHLDSVTILPLTSRDELDDRPLIEPDVSNGLNVASRAMMDKITTVAKSKLGAKIGELSDGDMERPETAVLVFMGIGRRGV